jgi:hypothetical protein
MRKVLHLALILVASLAAAQAPSVYVVGPPESGTGNTHFKTYVLTQATILGVTDGPSWASVETTTAAALTTPCAPTGTDICQQDATFPTLYHTYDWTSADATLAQWFTAGKKVNILTTSQTNGPNSATPYYLTTSAWTTVAGTQHYINVAKDSCSQDAGVAITSASRLTGGSDVATVTQNNSYNAGDTVWTYGFTDSTFNITTQAGVQIIAATPTSWTYHSGATNAVTATGSGFSESQVQSWFVPTDAGYTAAQEAFEAALVYHFNHSANVSQISYSRGLPAARGGEVVMLCPDQMVADGFPGYASQAQAKTTWLAWIQNSINYMATLNPTFQVINSMNPGWTGSSPDYSYADAQAGYAIAASNAGGHRNGFGSQGLQATDKCSATPPPPYSSADWVTSAANYYSGGSVSPGTQPIEGQQIDRSDPTAVYNGSCIWQSGLTGVPGFQGAGGTRSSTGSLVAYLPYAKSRHLSTLELYAFDAALAFDPTYCIESAGTCGTGSYPGAVYGMRCQGPTSATLPTCPGGHGDGTYAAALNAFSQSSTAPGQISSGVTISGGWAIR